MVLAQNSQDSPMHNQNQPDLYQLSNEINHLLSDLSVIYKKEFMFMVPLELLQYSHVGEIYQKMECDFLENPIKSVRIFEDFLQNCNSLYANMLNRFLDVPPTFQLNLAEPKDDRRFINPEWDKDAFFNSLKNGYYLITKDTLKWLQSLETVDRKTRQQLHFYVKNILNFFSPSNYLWTNPDVIQKTIETKGENLLLGYKNFLHDLVLNKGHLNIRTTDLSAFELGKNIAVTPGKIIYQNDLMQLIQYLPSTETVFNTPILFIPPWINKYYVLDLSPKNSLVKWLVNQGFTVYMISWVNPSKKHSHIEFSDYMTEGPLSALDIITKSAKVLSVHMVGYCIGGTLLGTTLAYMQKHNDDRAKSATYFMSLLDFSNPGELGVFFDKSQLEILEKSMEQVGYLNGRLLEKAFNTLRPNDLIWPYFINQYLLGNTPRAFDLLYWNSDSTNLPYKMYWFYLKNMYLKNLLKKPNRIKLKNTPINLGDIKTPSLFIASKTDHISLWRSVYHSACLTGGKVQFILSDSGHVRGVVNPPSTENKYNFRTNESLGVTEPLPRKPSEWLKKVTEHQGSWWPYWAEWLKSLDNEMVPARDPIQSGLTIIEDAPGTYVKRHI